MPDLLKLLRENKAVEEKHSTAFGVNKNNNNILKPTINESALDKTLQDVSSKGMSFKTPDFRNSSEYEKYDVSINPIDDDLDKQRAKNQGAFEQTINAVSQAVVSEVALGAALGGSNLLDFVGSKIFQGDGDYTNPVSKQLEEWQEQFRNNTPIYQVNPDKSFQFGDYGWWMSNLPSVASSLSLLIPSTGVVKGVSALGKLAKGSKTLNSFNKAVGISKIAPLTKNVISKGIEIGSTALLSRTMENYQEARGVYKDMFVQANDELNKMNDEEFNKFLNNNPQYKEFESKEDIAKDISTKSADRTFIEDYANIGFDVIQLYGLKNMWKATRSLPSTGVVAKANKDIAKYAGKTQEDIAKELSKRSITNKYLDKVKNTLYDGKVIVAGELSEGVEEGINFIAQQEGMNYGNTILGKEVNNSFDDRLANYLKDPQLYESAFWGVLGGVAFQKIGSGVANLSNKILKKENISEEKRRLAEINQRAQKWNSYVEDLLNINDNKDIYNKDNNGNYKPFESEAYKELAKQKRTSDYITDITINAAKDGNIDLLKSYISDKNLKQGFIEKGVIKEEEADEYIQNVLTEINNVEELYNNNLQYLANKEVDPFAAQIIANENTRIDIENRNIQKDLEKVDQTINSLMIDENISKNVSPNYQNYIDALVYIKKLQELNEIKRTLEKGKTLSEQLGAREVNNQIETIKETLKDNELNTFIISESLIRYTKDKNGNNVIDNKESQEFIDKSIENEDISIKEDNLKTLEFIKKEANEEYKKLFKISQELVDNSIAKSVYKIQQSINNSSKSITDNQIRKRINQLETYFNDAKDTAIDESQNIIVDYLNKYDTKEVLNYINRTSKEITNITEEDKAKLDDALTILDFENKDYDDVYKSFNKLAEVIILNKNTKETPKINNVKTTKLEKNEKPDDETKDGSVIKQKENIVPETIIPQIVKKEQSEMENNLEDNGSKDNEKLLNEVSSRIISAVKADNNVDLNQLKEKVITELMLQGYDKDLIISNAEPIIRSIENRLKRKREGDKENTFKSSVEDLVSFNSEIIEPNSIDEYLKAVDNYLTNYLNELNIKETNGKYFINLEHLMKYTEDNASDKQLANIIFNNIKNILIQQTNADSKYILTDYENVVNVNKEDFFNNINKVKEIDIKSLNKQRVNIYNQEETPEFIEAIESLQNEDELQYNFEENKINIKKNNVVIGTLSIPSINSVGAYVAVNDGWIYEIIRNNGNVESPLKDLFKEWLITRSDEQSVKELNDIITNLAYRRNISKEEYFDLINKFTNNKEIINAKTKGFISSKANAEQLLQGLKDLYKYLNKDYDNTDRYISINNWFNKLANSYDGVMELTKSNKIIKVADISDGEAIITNEKKPIKDAVVGLDTNKHKLAVATEKNSLSVSGTNILTNWNGVNVGSTVIVIPNRNGNNTYAHVYPNKTNDKNNSPEIISMINHTKQTLKDLIAKRTNDQISFDDFVKVINGLFANNSRNSSLFGGVVVVKPDNNSININIPGTDYTITFYNKTKSGKNAVNVKIKSEYSLANTKQTNDVIDNIIDRASFMIGFNLIKSDAYKNYPLGDNPILSKVDGKFNITIGDKTFSYNSFNEFLINNNLITTTLGKSDDGKSNFRRQGLKVGTNQILNIKIEDVEQTPVEDSNSLDTTSAITKIINSKSIKNKGSKISELLVDKATIKLFKRLGILPENIIFDEKLNVNAQINVKTNVVTIGNKFIELANKSPQQAFRKLIHEGLHAEIAKDRSILNNIEEIYNEFEKAIADEPDDSHIKQYLFNNEESKAIRLEEFFVESLTSKELILRLNEIKSVIDNETSKKKTLFQKIIEALMKLMNINIEEGSLYEKEFIQLSETFKVKEETKETTKVEEIVPKEKEVVKINTETNEFEFDTSDDVFNSEVNEVNNDNSYSNITQYLETINTKLQPRIATLLGDGTLNFSCK